ncbi:MAG TPA: hypothetical protein PL033_19115 [Candidatus Brocadiia bacterium]|nr:hypothetical protein [Candidatus Brocadiia bacterium]
MPDGTATQPWQPFGWQAMRLEVPEEWSLSHAEGDGKSGIVRLSDSRDVRLTLQWQANGSADGVPVALEKHIAQIKREISRSPSGWQVKRETNLVNWRDRPHESYACRGESEVNGIVWFCPACKRICHAAISTGAEDGAAVARRCLKGLCDHPTDGATTWSFYGHTFSIPERFRLERPTLRTGCLEMVFRHRESLIEVVRVSLAEEVLRGVTLIEWFKTFYGRRIEDFRREITESKHRGHEALECEGEMLWHRRASVLFRPYYMRAIAWRCSEEDKLYIFRWSAIKSPANEFEKFAGKVQCHET